MTADTSRHPHRLAALASVASALNHCADPAEALRFVLAEAATVIGEAGAVIALNAGQDRVELAAAHGIDEMLIARYATLRVSSEVPLTDAIRTGESVWLSSADERDERYPHLASTPNRTAASATLPLRIEGAVVGALGVGCFTSFEFSDKDKTFLLALADLTAAYLDRIGALSSTLRTGIVTASTGALSQRLLSKAPVGFALIDPDLRFVFVNEALAEIDGLPVEDHPGRPVLDVLPSLATEDVFDRATGGDDRPVSHELHGEAPAAPGDRRDWLVSYFPVRDDNGFVLAVGATVVDITERTRLEKQLRTAVADSAERALEHAARRIEIEHESVELLQQAILPRLPRIPGVELDALYLPAGTATAVGGDWYDVFTLPDGRLGVAIGDVAGHGVRAAALMALLRNSLRAYARLAEDPSEAIGWLNDLLADEPVTEFATALYAVYDQGTRTLAWVRAGHPYALVFSPGTAEYLDDEGGPPLGVASGHQYVTRSRQLSAGERLLLYTDGLVERRDEPIDVGLADLAAAARTIAPDKRAVCRALAHHVLGDRSLVDDVCLVLLALPPAAGSG
ncbi:MAG: SpoIIE family protein phosphatase [Actinobacteria bacterium]|nr:SpoIIE family protein phosphatase [Actinomycetota bacterium]